ncbi:MAG: hypothetical protein H6995_02685 [Pseudomonadales bacterium]|nr:hypothetical protein [Pseudomonadales bacterium]MCP5213895.1 hypothetical protein [Pseudomonadales bacterium]
MTTNSKEALLAGTIGAIVGLTLSFLANYFLVPFPGGAVENAVNNGISGAISGFMSGFMGLFMYLKKSG